MPNSTACAQFRTCLPAGLQPALQWDLNLRTFQVQSSPAAQKDSRPCWRRANERSKQALLPAATEAHPSHCMAATHAATASACAQTARVPKPNVSAQSAASEVAHGTHVQQGPVGQQLLQLLPIGREAQAATVQMQVSQFRGSSQPCRQRCLEQQGGSCNALHKLRSNTRLPQQARC